MVKELNFEAEKFKHIEIEKIKISNFSFMTYGHFPARNRSKSMIVFSQNFHYRNRSKKRTNTGHALGIWICGCSLFYKRELWATKSASAHSTRSLKIIGCKR